MNTEMSELPEVGDSSAKLKWPYLIIQLLVRWRMGAHLLLFNRDQVAELEWSHLLITVDFFPCLSVPAYFVCGGLRSGINRWGLCIVSKPETRIVPSVCPTCNGL